MKRMFFVPNKELKKLIKEDLKKPENTTRTKLILKILNNHYGIKEKMSS